MTEHPKDWTITAATDSGDTASIAARPEEKIKALLAKAVHALFGAQDPEKYEVLIDGTKVEDLELTLVQAGLHDGSEILVQAIEMHHG